MATRQKSTKINYLDTFACLLLWLLAYVLVWFAAAATTAAAAAVATAGIASEAFATHDRDEREKATRGHEREAKFLPLYSGKVCIINSLGAIEV